MRAELLKQIRLNESSIAAMRKRKIDRQEEWNKLRDKGELFGLHQAEIKQWDIMLDGSNDLHSCGLIETQCFLTALLDEREPSNATYEKLHNKFTEMEQNPKALRPPPDSLRAFWNNHKDEIEAAVTGFRRNSLRN